MEKYVVRYGNIKKKNIKIMKKIQIIGIIISVFFISTICKAEVSPFKPDWKIGDTWNMEFQHRDRIFPIDAARLRIIKPGETEYEYGDFSEPTTYVFIITGTKKIKGEKCFEIEMYRKYPDKQELIIRLYYTTDTLKIRLAEKILEDSRRIPDYADEKDGPVIESYFTSYLHFSWPDFTQLDPANSPQLFPWGNSKIQQIVEATENTLTITWYLSYNEANNTWSRFITQVWKKSNPSWSTYELGDKDPIASGEGKERYLIEKARSIFVADTEPPTISLTLAPDTLWPPDHKMVEIIPHITVSDNQDPSPLVSLESVTSSEPDDAPGAGDGHTTGDIDITQDGKIFLRAERDGKGSGRFYVITYSATDASGNKSYASAIVTVPHDVAKEKKK